MVGHHVVRLYWTQVLIFCQNPPLLISLTSVPRHLYSLSIPHLGVPVDTVTRVAGVACRSGLEIFGSAPGYPNSSGLLPLHTSVEPKKMASPVTTAMVHGADHSVRGGSSKTGSL